MFLWLLVLYPLVLPNLGRAASAPAVDVAGADDPQSLGAFLLMLEDSTGSLDLTGVVQSYQAGRMQPLPSNRPSLGFVQGAVWVRFELVNSARAEQERWLEADWMFQQFYDLYLVDGEGRSRPLANGSAVPLALRPLASRNILFPLRLQPGQHWTAYLRIAGRAATAIDLSLWTPAAFLEHQTRYLALKYLGIGSTSLVMVFSVLAWRALGRPGLLAMVPGQALTALVALAGDGFMQDLIATDDTAFWSDFWVQRSRNFLVSVTMLCHVVFARSFLDLPHLAPRLDRLWLILTVCCFVGMALPLLSVVAPLPQFLTVFVTGSLTAAALALARRRGSAGLSYLAAWGSLWLVIIVRVSQSLGWVPGIPFLNELWLVGLLGCGLAITYALYVDIETVRHGALAAQANLLALQQGQSERLVRAVEERTAQLAQATARAEAANRAKSVFLSMISHEFRTPLHTILGYTHLLGRHLEGELAGKLAVVERSGSQLLRLIDEVLEFSRGESMDIVLDKKPVRLESLSRFLGQTGLMLADERANRFQLTLEQGLPGTVEVDEQRLLQVLFNLIGNACKFTRRGTVRVSIAPAGSWTPGENGHGRQRVRFEVEDDGMGIPPEDQARIFDPFDRGQLGERHSGMGLGLAISRQLIRAMGSDIDVISQPGRGSRFGFTLDLDLAEGEAESSAADRGVIEGYEGPEKTLLVVDDIPENREMLRDVCTEWGFRVLLAKDGQQALSDWVQPGLPGIDLVLLDQFMPNRDGWDLLRAIRKLPNASQRPVILISAAPPEPPQNVPSDLRFDGVLLKPNITEPLAALLQNLLSLTWRRRPAPAAETLLPAGRLPAERIAEFGELVDLGRVLALARWSDKLAAGHPECAGFAAEIKRLAETANLGGLQRLLRDVRQSTDDREYRPGTPTGLEG